MQDMDAIMKFIGTPASTNAKLIAFNDAAIAYASILA